MRKDSTHSILILTKSNLVLEVGLHEFWVPPHLYRQHPVFVTSSQKHVWKFNAWKSNKRLTCYKGGSVPRELKKYDKKTLIMPPLLDTIWYISILLYMFFHRLFFQNSTQAHHWHPTGVYLRLAITPSHYLFDATIFVKLTLITNNPHSVFPVILCSL